MSLIAQMARSSRARANAVDSGRVAELAAQRTPRELVLGEGMQLIAEIKLRAPSVGVLSSGDPLERVRSMADAYAPIAAAISVLTEPLRFDGELAYLQAVAERVEVPAMRKDFLVDPVQVVEARAYGASGVLLIARMLSDEMLGKMLQTAAEQGLFVLLEAFDAADLRRCDVSWEGSQPLLVGVNTRDLSTLEVRAERLAELVEWLPAGRTWVAESGIAGPADAAHASGLGYGALLVGSALMSASDPRAAARALVDACG